jgi:hypothetical protein
MLSKMTQFERNYLLASINHQPDYAGYRITVSQIKSLVNDADHARQLLEGCRTALICPGLPDSVKEVIRQAIAGTLPID